MPKEIMIIAIVSVMTFGWLVNNWIRARHGYALENEWGGLTELPGGDKKTKAIEARAGELEKTVAEQADRIAVLEKIVTDRGYGLADEIEKLRDARSDNGVPLETGRRERA